jgi:hypothetical protein
LLQQSTLSADLPDQEDFKTKTTEFWGVKLTSLGFGVSQTLAASVRSQPNY